MFKFLMADVGWGDTPKWVVDVLQPIINVLDSLLLPIIIILGVAGMIYGIVLGVQYAKAESADKRDENKKRMIHGVIGIVIILVLLILMKVFTANADGIFGWVNTSSGRVVVTIEIGENGQSADQTAQILVDYGLFEDTTAAKEEIGNRTSVTVSFSQDEWDKISSKHAEDKGVKVQGEQKDTETTSVLPNYNNEWVNVSVA